jgi:hypothetical protein
MDANTATDQDIPEAQRELDGKRVVLRGEMWKPDGMTKVKRFEVVYSIARCCVTSTPKIQHFLHATMVDGKTTEGWAYQMIEVVGTLHVGIIRDAASNKIKSVFRIDAESVKLVQFGVSSWVWVAVAAGVVIIGAGLWFWRKRAA